MQRFVLFRISFSCEYQQAGPLWRQSLSVSPGLVTPVWETKSSRLLASYDNNVPPKLKARRIRCHTAKGRRQDVDK
ncbi:hypothetical protein PILCRDRAFT_819496 [Piloderma croceum F 1598]|uniref:Uncharacterized protein n=1 Tax=Piloderma croceum (strain F 1598) TaxID=765440 RepID=A0A0C3BAE5_PILCF|nr:hypothetical protein PILCRDRAFT_819496 [Piloderma croceum F 1598]